MVPVLHEDPRMRISDDRYHRERARMELALRFLRHEARTQTIRAWTGLSDDRIRKLYRSYLGHARRQLPRHRGKSPHQVAYFTRSLRLQEETALLASVLSLLGVLPGAEARGDARPDAWRAAVPGVRGLPAAAALGTDLLRARGVPRHRARPRRPAAPGVVQRVRRPPGHGALSRCAACAASTAAPRRHPAPEAPFRGRPG